MKDEGKKPDDLNDRLKKYALRIIRLYRALPKTTEAGVLGKQLLRSGTSVGAQYREAKRARSNAEFTSKIDSALQELDESGWWLDLLGESAILPTERLLELLNETEELIRIMTSIVKKVKTRGSQ